MPLLRTGITGPIVLRSKGAFKSAQLNVDREKRVIQNVSVIRKGPALGHKFLVDDTMLQQVATQINAKSKGVKSRLTHPGIPDCGGSDGIETSLGRLKNARVQDEQVVGDLHIAKFASKGPAGDLASYVMDIAEEDPEIAGMSIVFDPDEFEEKPDPENEDEMLRFGRSKDTTACDLVGDPAANAGGMLSSLPATVLSNLPKDLLGHWMVAAGLLSEDSATVLDELNKVLDQLLTDRTKMKQQSAGDPAAPDDTKKPGADVASGVGPLIPLFTGGPFMDQKLLLHLAALGLNPTANEADAKAFLKSLTAAQKTALRQLCGATATAVPPEAAEATPPPNTPAAQGAGGSAAPTQLNQGVVPPVDHLADDTKRLELLNKLAEVYKLGDKWATEQIVALAGQETIENFVKEARKAALASLAKKNPPANDIYVGNDTNTATLGVAIADAVLLRAGNKLYELDGEGEVVFNTLADGKRIPKERAAHARTKEFRHLSLLEMARAHLHAFGVNTVGLSRSEVASLVFNKGKLAGKIGMIALSQGIGDFPGILGDTINKSLRLTYMVAPVTWNLWAKMNTNPDFKNITRLQLSETDLRGVAPGGEYEETALLESKEVYKLSKYGRIISFNWETLVNDDLNAFGEVPRKMGNACRRKEDEVAYAPLTSNQTMLEDNTVLFHTAKHGNLAASPGGISVASLTDASAAMKIQKDIASKDFLDIQGKYLLVSVQQEVPARQLMRSTADPAKPNAGANNPFQGSYDVVGTPRISGLQWFLAADQNQYDTVEVCFLEGQSGPTFEEENGFDSDKRRFKVRHVVASRALDYRGLYKNNGQ